MSQKPICPNCGLPDPGKNPYCFCKPPATNLHALFKVDNESIRVQTMLNGLGHHIRKHLATGVSTVTFQVDRDVAARMADLFILDD